MSFIPLFMMGPSRILGDLGRDNLDASGCLLIESADQFWSILEVIFWFPSAIFIAVTFPFDKVLCFAITSSFLDDHFSFEFFFIINNNCWWRILALIWEFFVIVIDPGFQEIDVEYQMDLEFSI